MFIHLIMEGVHATIVRQVPCAKADPPHIIANAMFARSVLDTIKVYSVPEVLSISVAMESGGNLLCSGRCEWLHSIHRPHADVHAWP
jgi:hypothetical protein